MKTHEFLPFEASRRPSDMHEALDLQARVEEAGLVPVSLGDVYRFGLPNEELSIRAENEYGNPVFAKITFSQETHTCPSCRNPVGADPHVVFGHLTDVKDEYDPGRDHRHTHYDINCLDPVFEKWTNLVAIRSDETTTQAILDAKEASKITDGFKLERRVSKAAIEATFGPAPKNLARQ